MPLEIQPAYHCQETVRLLFEEYTDMLVGVDLTVAECLRCQKYGDELESLIEKYGPPHGRLYIVVLDGGAAGCVALHRLDLHRCEMKRLYVRPSFRGNHIASRLVETIITDAKTLGYTHMVLDTPFLTSAIRMYERLGVYRIDPYNDNPMPGAVFLQLDLQIAR